MAPNLDRVNTDYFMSANNVLDVLERRINQVLKKLLEQKQTIERLNQEKAEIERRLSDKNRQIALLKQEVNRQQTISAPANTDNEKKQELLREKIKEMIERIDHVDSS